ncbi:MAG TPA: NAD(P)-dependent alcohol dehydrogenase [Pyrinomonadaceae bacterium]|nr:NAD(P)-dependent alcohol dehydrogenase [Pyrinomonadaceae bacterium]
MIQTRGYATASAQSGFEPFDFERREVGARDVLIDVQFCGICHSDIHQARNEWGNSIYPMVPGHEIVGRVAQIGGEVTKFKEGDIAGIGCFVDSCRSCANCSSGFEQFCTTHLVATYNSTEMDEKTPTYGGYSNKIVIDEAYALRISPEQPLERVAPLLCAGITTYSPLKRFKAGAGKKVGVVGLGGLGHMGVKLAASMGAEVTVFSTSPSKEQDARSLGAHNFVVTREPENMAALAGQYDLILDTVSAQHDLNMYLSLLRLEGVLALVGAPEKPMEIHAFSLITNNRMIAGSMIGGIEETQEMLDYCAANDITSDVEIISIRQIEEAYERTIKADVRYRFVIDLKTLNR